jgi:cytochrome c5
MRKTQKWLKSKRFPLPLSARNPMPSCRLLAIQRLFITGLLALIIDNAQAMGSRPPADDEGIATRIQPIGRVEFAAAAAGSGAPRSGEEIVKSSCSACHATGAAGAPKIGDKAAWASRLGQGLEGLLKSAINGKNAMPPKGGSNASDLELERAVVHMANQSGAHFKEPAEKK